MAEDDELLEADEEDEDSDTASYEIISYGADFTLSVLCEKLNSKKIYTPQFQRNYVWNQKQGSKLVESFLLGLPVPGIFLSKDDENKLLVVDGQQRLKTIQAFKEGKFPLTGESFTLIDVKSQWAGKTYNMLEPEDKNKFDDSVLRATIIQQVNPKEDDTSIYHIFERLNTGGTRLQNQEIRNCVYHGVFNDLLKELNTYPAWRTLYNNPVVSKRMKDEELILRFFAFHYNFENYSKPLSEFLSKFMSKNRTIDRTKLTEFKKLFQDTVDLINSEAGLPAFRPTRNLNVAAFDTIMFTVSRFKEKLKPDLKNNIKKLFSDDEFSKTLRGGTTDEENIRKRFRIAERILVK